VPCETFQNKVDFYGKELLATRPTPRLEDYPLWSVLDYLFNIFAATLYILDAVPSIRNPKTRHIETGTYIT
jgi:hypothetical protein